MHHHHHLRRGLSGSVGFILVMRLGILLPGSRGDGHESLEFSFDMFAGEMGYYKVKGYDGVQPALKLEVGKEYHFEQKDITNWMHPLGLAFQPDGAHDVLYDGKAKPEEGGAPEVADGPGTAGYEYVYLVDGVEKTLDDYEPMFFWPKAEWAKHTFVIRVKITDAAFATSLVYFCHIHNKMSARLDVNGGTGEHASGPLTGLYDPSVASEFDQKCGTFGASAYQDQCPNQEFLCGKDTGSDFAKCMVAIDCNMYKDMMSSVIEQSETATFMQQMIPHHLNAVNMARILLKHTTTYGGTLDLAGEPGEYDGIEDMLVDMVNVQNYQVSEMRKWLLEEGHALDSDCEATGRRQLKKNKMGSIFRRRRQLQQQSSILRRRRQLQQQGATITPAKKQQRRPMRRLDAHTGGAKKAEPCAVAPGEIEFSFDLFAGEMGYYKVKGCPNGVQPALKLEVGTEYKFVQKDTTNWMHPLGLAFKPDGAHDVLYDGADKPEEGGAPEVGDGAGTEGYEYIYLVDGKEVTLDDYEPMFFYPLSEWASHTFEIRVRFTDLAKLGAMEIFYFCHVHNFMSARIVFDGQDVADEKKAPLYPPALSAAEGFDHGCGTFGAGSHAMEANFETMCPKRTFLCGATDSAFAKCLQAVDCHMNERMSIANTPDNPTATFMHQMIPHHQNAVNMARALLKLTTTYGGGTLDLAGEPGEYDGIEDMLLEMVNVQNYQASEMRKWLLEQGLQTAGETCTAEGEAVGAGVSAGSCYDDPTYGPPHTVACNVAEADCNGMKWYPPGMVSKRNNCCHCKAGCPKKYLTPECEEKYYADGKKTEKMADHDDHDDHDDHEGGEHKDSAPAPASAPDSAGGDTETDLGSRRTAAAVAFSGLPLIFAASVLA